MENYLSFRHAPNYDGSEPVDDAGKTIEPMGYGKLQSEAAEVYFTEISIQEIDVLPAGYAHLFC